MIICGREDSVEMSDDKSRKSLSIIIIVSALIVTIFFCMFIYNRYHNGYLIRLSEYELLSDDMAVYHINSFTEKNIKYDYMEAWAFKSGEEMTDFQTRLVLYKDGDDNARSFITEMGELSAINDSIEDGVDYSNTLFRINIDKKYSEDEASKIAFLINTSEGYRIIKTDIYIKDL